MAITIPNNPDLSAALNDAHTKSVRAQAEKIDYFKNYVYYLNENRNLKYLELKMHQTPAGSWFYYCKFTEPAFILGVFLEGATKEIPKHSLSNLNIKEIAFQTLPYYNDTWIESEDFRKVDTYFAFTNTDYGG
jgi:hypothetical protein